MEGHEENKLHAQENEDCIEEPLDVEVIGDLVRATASVHRNWGQNQSVVVESEAWQPWLFPTK